MSDAPGSVRGWTRLFRAVLRIYPKSFRERFGDAMAETFTDRQAASGTGFGSTASAIALLAEAAWSGLRERFRPWYDPSPNRPRMAPHGGNAADSWLVDFRLAVRALVRRPRFTLAALITLALGIGANTAVFSVVQGVLLTPLPYPAPDQLAMVWSYDVDAPEGLGWMSLPDIDDVRELPELSGVEGWNPGGALVDAGGNLERVTVARVTGGFIDLFGLAPHLGRDLEREEAAQGSAPVVVVGHGFWESRLGARSDVVGSTILLSEVSHEVVGVAPPGFDFPDATQLWVPLRHDLEGCGRGCGIYQAVGRLRGDDGGSAADERLLVLAERLERVYPDTNSEKRFRTEPLLDHRVGDVRAGLWVLLGAVGLVLLIVCANLANLLLVRASTRRTEVALRAALGATRGRLVWQILAESIVLAGIGGALGISLAFGLLEGFRRLAPVSVPRLDEVGLDGTVLLAALVLTAFATLAFGLSPAIRLSRSAAGTELTGAARSGGAAETRTRGALVAIEIGLSLALLFGAGVLMRSLSEMYRVDLGFHEREVVRFSMSLPTSRYETLEEVVAFYSSLESSLSALPGVEAVGSVQGAPLAGGNVGGPVFVEGRPEPEPGDQRYASVRPVTAGYMETLGLTILRGRGIHPTDGLDTEPVAVVNETFVREHFGDGEALGQRFRITASYGYGSPTWTVVGVVADVRRSLTGQPIAELYVSHGQFGPAFMQVHLRGPTGVASVMPAVRDELRRLDPSVVPANVETIREAIRDDTAQARFYLMLVGSFAGLAALLASIGLYGVVAYVVSRRTREIGIRIALGAGRSEIMSMIVRQGSVQTAVGLAIGVAASLLGSRYLESLLFNVRPADPLVLGSVSVLVAVISMFAIILPARAATRVSPRTAFEID